LFLACHGSFREAGAMAEITATGQKERLQIMEMQVHPNTALIMLKPLSGSYRSRECFSSKPSKPLWLLRDQTYSTALL
jgi:hypothetical protein